MAPSKLPPAPKPRQAVRLDTMSTCHIAVVSVFTIICVLIPILIGWGIGPPLYSVVSPNEGNSIPLGFAGPPSRAICTDKYDGESLPANAQIPKCWNFLFRWTSKWVQYFDVRLTNIRVKRDTDVSKPLELPVIVTWLAQEKSGEPWRTLYEAAHTYTVRCSGTGSASNCDPLVLSRMSSLKDERYFFQIYVQPNASLESTAWINTVDFVYNQRQADFAIFELGTKSFFLGITIILALFFMTYTGFDFGCGVWCCCVRRSRTFGFRQCSVNWIYALLIGLFCFNQPFLSLQYYAPSAGAQWIGVAMQLTFVALLASYWIVELLITPEAPYVQGRRRTWCSWFFAYGLMFAVLSVYWLSAIVVYYIVMTRSYNDPLYDWQQEIKDNADLRLIGYVFGGVYVAYIVGLMLYSLISMCVSKTGGRKEVCNMKLREVFVLCVHLIAILATAGGITAGVVYQYDVRDAFELMFYTAIFNVYVFLLVYLYTPSLYQELDDSLFTLGPEEGGANMRNDDDEENPKTEEAKVSGSSKGKKSKGLVGAGGPTAVDRRDVRPSTSTLEDDRDGGAGGKVVPPRVRALPLRNMHSISLSVGDGETPRSRRSKLAQLTESNEEDDAATKTDESAGRALPRVNAPPGSTDLNAAIVDGIGPHPTVEQVQVDNSDFAIDDPPSPARAGKPEEDDEEVVDLSALAAGGAELDVRLSTPKDGVASGVPAAKPGAKALELLEVVDDDDEGFVV